MCKTKSQESTINVNITDIVLTPLTCASIINEMIKCLVYSKSQIPYPYSWLKSIVSRKRKNGDEEPSQRAHNFTVERHYREVFGAYSTLEDIMANIRKELGNPNNVVNEVIILFGSTLFSVKEMFRIKIPYMARGHSESTHLGIAVKNQHKVLREILFSEEWMEAMELTIPLTNMFVLLKKGTKGNQPSEFFHLNRQYSAPKRAHNVSICLNYSSHEEPNCCSHMSVYSDGTCVNGISRTTESPTPEISGSPETSCSPETSSINGNSNVNDISSSRQTSGTTDIRCISEDIESETDKLDNMECSTSNIDCNFYEAKILFKGFKDCFIDKVSVSQLW